MRRISLVPVILAVTLGSAMAAGPRVIAVDPSPNAPRPVTEADFEKYRGYMFDLSDFADRKDFGAISENLRKQLDVVETAGLSPRVTNFFHSVPIVASEMDCLDIGAGAACYGPIAPTRRNRTSLGVTTWDHARHQWTNPDMLELAADSGRGVIMLRPNLMQYADDPVLLHEFMHAYHARLLPSGYDNKGVIGYYAEAKSKELFGKNVYAVMNHKEFFAVTASIFLSGKDFDPRAEHAGEPEGKDAGLLQVPGGPVRVRPGSDAPRRACCSGLRDACGFGSPRDAGRLGGTCGTGLRCDP